MKMKPGGLYVNGRGDTIGPMEELDADLWRDQHGSLYHSDGRQWDHRPDSGGNLADRPSGVARLEPKP